MMESGSKDQFVTSCDMWPDENLLIEKVLEDSTTGQEHQIRFFDMPKLH